MALAAMTPEHLDELISRLKEGYKKRKVEITVEELFSLIDSATTVMMSQPMLVEVKAPCHVFGDIHGQYKDLLRAFNMAGWPSQTEESLFLGDYVDRGRRGVETIALLLALKVKYPNTVHLLRGNHETSEITRVYGFYDECKKRYSEELWKVFIMCFNSMPVAAIINKCVLCMHGGLSPKLEKLEDINALTRPAFVPAGGLMCDLLWSDPDSELTSGWGENVRRGISFSFAEDIVKQMCKDLQLDLIVRAHQVVPNGYEFFADRHLVTVFTAPNYCGQFANDGAILMFNKDLDAKYALHSCGWRGIPESGKFGKETDRF